MAYSCPRCGDPVQRGSSTGAAVAGGVVGALIASAFGSFHCQKCGAIPKREFPSDVRQKMTLGSVAMIVSAVVLLVALIGLLVLINR